jgi:hypothetical protein
MLTVNTVPSQAATVKCAKQKRCTSVLSQDGWVSRMPPVRPPIIHAHLPTTQFSIQHVDPQNYEEERIKQV